MTGERLEQARSQAFHDVGRNIVNYQKVEQLMKALLKLSGQEGYLSDIHDRLRRRGELVDRKSMGQFPSCWPITKVLSNPDGKPRK